MIASPAVAARPARKVQVECAVLVTGNYANPQDLANWETDRLGASKAYEKAGMGPEDINLVECHDAFTISEILHYEALGLCPPGEGGRLVDEGAVALGGRVPVNPSGGLLSRGHPVGATGVARIVEVVTLPGNARPRRASGASVLLFHGRGNGGGTDRGATHRGSKGLGPMKYFKYFVFIPILVLAFRFAQARTPKRLPGTMPIFWIPSLKIASVLLKSNWKPISGMVKSGIGDGWPLIAG